MRSIRNRLLISFLGIIGSLLVLGVLFITMHFALIDRYKAITNNMVAEYQLTEAATDMVTSFNAFVKSVNDPTQQAKYEQYREQIFVSFAYLDTSIVSSQSKVAYLGLKNTLLQLINLLDSGVEQAKQGNIANLTDIYNESLHQSFFVRENTATLVLDELQYAEQIQIDISHQEYLAELLGGLLFAIVGAGALFFSFTFSKHLVAPLESLTILAKTIANGAIERNVDPMLLATKDEVGSLAVSFDTMLQSLRSNIRALDLEKKSVEKKVEERTRELSEERARLLASINSLSFGFIIIDAQEKVMLANGAARDILQTPEVTLDIIVKKFGSALQVDEQYRRIMAEKTRFEIAEIPFGERFLRAIFAPILLVKPAGEAIGMVLLLEDITERKRLDQSKSSFLSIASHEMRTPLTIIRGNAELILDDPLVQSNSGLAEQVQSILKGSVRLLAIVNDFLDVQNLETGSITLKIEPVEFGKAIEEVIADLRRLAEARGLTLEFDPKAVPELPTFMMDKYRLQQIFTNLVSNAIHYTEKGKIKVWVEKDASTVNVFFGDTGIGMTSDEQAHLFQRFQTGRSFLRSKEYGSGLGLYIARVLARLMGGDLVLEKSAVNEGTTFRLFFPLAAKGGVPAVGRYEKSVPVIK